MNRRPRLPAEPYLLVERAPGTVLLEGGWRSSKTHKSSRLFTAPVRICAAWRPEEIPALFDQIESAVASGQSAAGFFSYECRACFEPKATWGAGSAATAEAPQPLAWFGIYERSYAFDDSTGAFTDGTPPKSPAVRGVDDKAETEIPPGIAAEFSLTEAEYSGRVAAIHDLIRAGEVYQLNFTAPFHCRVQSAASALYAQLRARQPVEYGAFLHWQQGRFIQSFSPELFFHFENHGSGRHIVTRPMKGTAPRGHTTREDQAIAEWLRNDPKNRSENIMIVDLLRSDLGRVAQTGSVRAERLFEVERYPTLWQMTSTVSAELRPDVGFYDIFRALFPSGSVTGAPKVRAMQRLAELEQAPRGVYTGAIGFFSPQETVFNVAIRTLELENGRGIMGAGSGIVIDSDPAAEFRECQLKAEFLAGNNGRPESFSLLETMLWNGAYTLIDLHLDRLADSADYFGFAFDTAAIREGLELRAGGFADRLPRKVRLLLDAEGKFDIAEDVLRESGERERIARVAIAPQRTDPGDAMLYHKTTHRPLYASEFARAARDGYDDVLFMNVRGEVTEGAISNIFVEKDGRWATPPIECGLLAGVYRRHLLLTRPEIEERVLTLEELRGGDAVYLTNAVRGLRRAVMDTVNPCC